MYWFLESASNALPLLLFLVLAALAGRGLLMGGFDVPERERWVVGAALGIAVVVWVSNVLGRWIQPPGAFWLAAAIAALAAAAAARWVPPSRKELGAWSAAAVVVGVALGLTVVGRGLAVFDDRKNLSLISTMAAGDIPPHFYMNDGFYFPYHYGFQLFGAILMRVGGLFPWSAFDLAKGVAGGLAIGVTATWGRRAVGRWWGGIVAGLLVAFASGTRWLLLFLPQGLLDRVSASLSLWGSAAQTAPDLASALGAGWVIEGGPPVPIPFAFANGILQPFAIQVHAGPKSLGLMALFLFLLLAGRARNRTGWALLVVVLATLALAAEAEFALISVGLVLAVLALGKDHDRRTKARGLGLVVLGALAIAAVQGGTLTEAIRNGTGSEAGGSVAGFSLRPAPAVVSAHLGEMRLARPAAMAAAIFELGPAILLAPAVGWAMVRWARRGRSLELGYAASAFLGFLLPMFLRYEVDRDIARMAQHALLAWLVLSVPLAAAAIRLRPRAPWKEAALAVGGSVTLGGVVALGPLLTAAASPTLSTEIAPVDAGMTRAAWDSLRPGALVLDSHEWRAVAVTGRLTRSARDSFENLPEWEALVADGRAGRAASEGFDYVYVDTFWWDSMDDAARASYGEPCVELVLEMHDNAFNGSRWLYDVDRCAPESGGTP
jgi:hypothetical protein